jgi:hypothetical protein
MPDEVSELSDALATLMVSETPRFKEAKRQAIVRDPRSPPLGYALFKGHTLRQDLLVLKSSCPTLQQIDGPAHAAA